VTVRLVHTMGTVISLDVRSDRSAVDLGGDLDAAEAVLHDADALFSTYRPGSWISRLARRDVRSAELPPEVLEVLALCADVEGLTEGFFTARWRGDGTLDPTGLVKGWAAGRASRVLTERGLPNHCVNAAGDIALGGRPEEGRNWRVGVADPRAPGSLLGVVDAPAGVRAVATSGVGERGRHVVDPRSGHPVDGVLSATVMGPDSTLADGLATALVAAGRGAPALLAGWRPLGWHGCVLTEDGRLLDPEPILAS
jgi:thiamine biosynthesis lipoprotein